MNCQVYALASRGNNKRMVREGGIFMVPDKFCKDASEGWLAQVIEGELEAMNSPRPEPTWRTVCGHKQPLVRSMYCSLRASYNVNPFSRLNTAI